MPFEIKLALKCTMAHVDCSFTPTRNSAHNTHVSDKKSRFCSTVETAILDDGNLPRALVLTKLIEWYRFEVGDENSIFVFFCFLSSERNDGQRAKTLRKNYARMRSTPPKLTNRAPKSGRRSRPLCVPFFWVLEEWNALAHSCSQGVRTQLAPKIENTISISQY